MSNKPCDVAVEVKEDNHVVLAREIEDMYSVVRHLERLQNKITRTDMPAENGITTSSELSLQEVLTTGSLSLKDINEKAHQLIESINDLLF